MWVGVVRHRAGLRAVAAVCSLVGSFAALAAGAPSCSIVLFFAVPEVEALAAVSEQGRRVRFRHIGCSASPG